MLKPAIAVSVVDFSLFPEYSEYQTDVVPVIEGTQTIYSDKMRLRFFELRKLRIENGNFSQHDLKYLWLCLFNAKSIKDLDMLRETRHPDIVTACDMLQTLSEDEKARNTQWAREKELHDMASLIADGWKEGREDGMKEEKEKTAMNMLTLGMSIDVIEKVTGLTEDEIKALNKDLD